MVTFSVNALSLTLTEKTTFSPGSIEKWLITSHLDMRNIARVHGFNISVPSKVPVIERQNALYAMDPYAATRRAS